MGLISLTPRANILFCEVVLVDLCLCAIQAFINIIDVYNLKENEILCDYKYLSM